MKFFPIVQASLFIEQNLHGQGKKNNQACFSTLGHVYIFDFGLPSTVGQNRNNADLLYQYGPFPVRSHCR